MTKVSSKDLRLLYSHLSVQSILDIKDNFKEVSLSVFEELNNKCLSSFKVEVDGKIQCIGFFVDAGSVYNFLLYSGSHFIKNKDKCIEQIKEQLKLLKNKEINSIIYKNANQVLKTLYSIGFSPVKEVKGYKILELIK